MRSPYFPARSVLFRKESNGVTYRVPALLYLPRSNSFLAFCEERLSPSDSQAHLLVLRKGTFYKNYVEWEDLRVLGSAHLQGHRSMNPCPVYDEFTGTLFLFFIAVLGNVSERYQLVSGKNVTRLCCVSSTDAGDTWGPATDLTKGVIGDTINEWATFALGPGHGVQLKSGRLVVPAYAYHIDCKRCFSQLTQTTPHSLCFYSENHGGTWRRGEAVQGPDSLECQLVSVDEEDGGNVLYCNARSPLGCRVQALSLDQGTTFQPGQLVTRLLEPRNGCHGSIVGFPAPIHLLQPGGVGRNAVSARPPHPVRSTHWTPRADPPSLRTTAPPSSPATADGGGFAAPPGPKQSTTDLRPTHPDPSPKDFQSPTWVVYSHPTVPNSRRDLGVFLSPFPRDPDSWAGPWVIYEGPSAYSDLAHLELASSPGDPPAVAFACLFESGTLTAYDEISFCVFTLYELIDHLPERTALHGSRPDAVSKSRPRWGRRGNGGDSVTPCVRTLACRKIDKKISRMCTLS